MESLDSYTGNTKVAALKKTLTDYGSVLIGLSGGVDSGFLLKAAVDFLQPENVLACTSSGPIYPDGQLSDARELAGELGVEWRKVERDLLVDQEFTSNPPNRCYHCKLDLFNRLLDIAGKEGLNVVADGSIQDDRTGHRPGRQAGKELDIKSPLKDVELTKKEVRKYGKEIGLPVWDRPSNSCLATRVPFGSTITEEKLARIEKSEAYLKEMGFEGFRVRDHGEVSRIELSGSAYEDVLLNRDQIVEGLKDSGYKYVTLDLEGYRPSIPR